MRRVYLVRHGHPDIPLRERWCLGHTDLPLAAVGRMQAALLPFVPELLNKPVYSSWLSRAVETARPLCRIWASGTACLFRRSWYAGRNSTKRVKRTQTSGPTARKPRSRSGSE